MEREVGGIKVKFKCGLGGKESSQEEEVQVNIGGRGHKITNVKSVGGEERQIEIGSKQGKCSIKAQESERCHTCDSEGSGNNPVLR